jgi:hypothetical protein
MAGLKDPNDSRGRPADPRGDSLGGLSAPLTSTGVDAGLCSPAERMTVLAERLRTIVPTGIGLDPCPQPDDDVDGTVDAAGLPSKQSARDRLEAATEGMSPAERRDYLAEQLRNVARGPFGLEPEPGSRPRYRDPAEVMRELRAKLEERRKQTVAPQTPVDESDEGLGVIELTPARGGGEAEPEKKKCEQDRGPEFERR